jgi:hypothetical protein
MKLIMSKVSTSGIYPKVPQEQDELTLNLAIRAMRDIGSLWGDHDSFYLRAAATFVDNFHGWTF